MKFPIPRYLSIKNSVIELPITNPLLVFLKREVRVTYSARKIKTKKTGIIAKVFGFTRKIIKATSVQRRIEIIILIISV
jgi:hypothetical protein